MITNAKIISIGTNPDDYHKKEFMRCMPEYPMSSGDIREFALCPAKYRAGGEEDVENNSLLFGSLLDCLLLTPMQFSTRFALQPETYTDAKGIVKPFTKQSNTCKEWIVSQGDKTIISADKLEEVRRAIFVTTHYMDEAENCNRLVMIYHGTMIAMGSPEEMKTKVMKHEILEIVKPHAETWLEKISGLESIKETALFGVNIHAVASDAEKGVLELKKLFDAQGLSGYSVNKIKASLEDVFVSLIENYDAEHKEK